MFLSTLAKNLVVVCSLANFQGLPSKVEGTVTLATKSFYHLKMINKNKTQTVSLVIEKKYCKEK